MKLAVLLLFGACTVMAQTYGSIVGTARDSTGAVVPAAKVTVTNEATGITDSQITNEVGAYSFTTLMPGRYRIGAELSGFRTVEISGIELQVNQTARHDLVLQVGQVAERVEVEATLAALSTDTSEVGQVKCGRR
jgi:hypothetical protein